MFRTTVPFVVDVRGVLGVPGTSKSVSSMLSLHEIALNGKGFLIIIELSSSPSYIFNFAHLLDTPFMIDNLPTSIVQFLTLVPIREVWKFPGCVERFRIVVLCLETFEMYCQKRIHKINYISESRSIRSLDVIDYTFLYKSSVLSNNIKDRYFNIKQHIKQSR